MDEKQLQELYNSIVSKDSTYKDKISYDLFKQKMADKAYSDKIMSWLGEINKQDKTYQARAKAVQQPTGVQKFQADVSVIPSIKPKETPSFVKEQVNTITPELLSKQEEFVVPELRYKFGPLGFKFEESGFGTDYVKVTSPDGKKIEVSLDDNGNIKDTERLKNFLTYRSEAIPNINNLVSEYEGEKKKFNSKKEIGDSITSFSKKQNDVMSKIIGTVKKRDSIEEEIDRLNEGTMESIISVLGAEPRSKEDYEKFTKEKQRRVIELVRQRDELNKDISQFANSKEYKSVESERSSLKKAVGSYTTMKAEQGNMPGALMNGLLTGVGRITASYAGDFAAGLAKMMGQNIGLQQKEIINIAKEKGIKVPENIDIRTEQGRKKFDEWFKTLPLEQREQMMDDANDKVMKLVKYGAIDEETGTRRGGISDIFRQIPKESLGDKSVTTEYEDLAKSEFWAGSLIGLAESIPAMIGAPGPAGWAIRTANMFSLTKDYVEEEMAKDPEFENISESEKAKIVLPYAIASAVLESYGIRNIIQSKGVLNNIIYRALNKSGAGATSKTFSEFVRNEVKSGLARGTLVITAGALAEAETGSAQRALEIGIKEVYNASKGKEMFKNLPQTYSDIIKDVAYSGAQEAVGGLVIGTIPGAAAAYRKQGFLGMSDSDFELFEAAANDPLIEKAFIAELKSKVNSGDMTMASAKEMLNDYRKSVGLFNSLPENLSMNGKKEAMNLLREKRELERQIENKDEALVAPQKDRIKSINEQLTKLSQNAIQEQSADAGVLRGEGPQVGLQEVVQGDQEPQVATGGTQAQVTAQQPPVQITGLSISDPEVDTRITDEKQKGVLSFAKKAVNAISSIMPGVEFVVHDNSDSYAAAVSQRTGKESKEVSGTSGYFTYGTDGSVRIDLDLSRANNRTVAHEVAHAVLYKKFNDDFTLYKDFRDRLSGVISSMVPQDFVTDEGELSTVKQALTDFVSRYKDQGDEVKAEEFITELSAMLANNEAKISTSGWNKISSFIGDFVSKITGGKINLFEGSRTTRDVVDFFNSMSKSIAAGEDLSGVNFARRGGQAPATGQVTQGVGPVSPNDAEAASQGLSVSIGEPTQIKSKASIGNPVSFPKSPRPLSFVTEADKIDIASLINDIISKKQTIWFWMADQLGRGNYYDEVIGGEHYLDAGPSFALDPENRNKGILWASGVDIKSLQGNIDKSDYIFFISGSPQKAKLYNKRVLELHGKRVGDFDSFKAAINNFKGNETKQLTLIKNTLNGVKSFDELAEQSSKRKPYLLAIDEISSLKTAPEGSLKQILESFNAFIDYDNLRDGFYRDNGFDQNDIMLVGKPTGLGGKSSHSTYQTDILGEVVGVPDRVVDAWSIMPESLKASQKNIIGREEKTKTVQTKVIAAETGITWSLASEEKVKGKASRTAPLITDKKILSQMTEDNDGNFLFYHISPNKITGKIDPKFFGRNLRTGRDERPGIGISMYYTRPDRADVSGQYRYVAAIPKENVYPFNEDPLNLYDKAEAEFNKMFPGQAFDPNKQVAFISREAEKLGYQMTVAKWGDGLRAQTTKPLKAEWYQRPKGNDIEVNEKFKDFKANAKTTVKGKASRTAPEVIEKNVEPVIQKIKSASLQDMEGGTFNPDGTTYKGLGLVVTGVSRDTDQQKLKASDVSDFAETHARKIKDNENVKIGLFKFEWSEQVSIDLNVIVDEKYLDKALEFAKIAGQNSIYNIRTGETIPTGESGRKTRSFNDEQFSEIAKNLVEGKIPDFVYDPEVYEVGLEKATNEELSEIPSLIARINDWMGIMKDVSDNMPDSVKSLIDNYRKELERRGFLKRDESEINNTVGSKKDSKEISLESLDDKELLNTFLLAVEINKELDVFNDISKYLPIGFRSDLKELIGKTDKELNKRRDQVKPEIKGKASRTAVEEMANKIEDLINTFNQSIGGYAKEDSVSSDSKRSITQKSNYARKKLEKLLGFDIGNFPSQTEEQKNIRKSLYKLLSLVGEGRNKVYSDGKELSDAYKQAKEDGSNPELVKDVEDAIGAKPEIKGKASRMAPENEVSEKTLPGYDSLVAGIAKYVSNAISRGDAKADIVRTVVDIAQSSPIYESANDVQREQIVREARKAAGASQKSSPSVSRLFGTAKDVKSITMTDYALLKKQIADINKGARDMKKAWLESSRELGKYVRDMAGKGYITPKQAAAVVKKFSGVNVLSQKSIDKFVDYMQMVFDNAEYAEKISSIRTMLPNARKNLGTKIGIADGLADGLARMLSINPLLIPETVLDTYQSVVKMMSERKAVLNLRDIQDVTQDVSDVLDAVELEQSSIPSLKDLFDDYTDKVLNQDGSINFAETINKMVKNNNISQETADIMKKYKSEIMPSPAAAEKTQAEIDAEKTVLANMISSSTVNADRLPTRDERELARKISHLIKNTKLERLSLDQLNNLLSVIDNINNGYVPHIAQMLAERMESTESGTKLSKVPALVKPNVLKVAYSKIKSLLANDSAMATLIKRNSLGYIDQVFGDYKTKTLFNSVLKGVAQAQAKFDSYVSQLNERINKAENEVLRSHGYNHNKALMSKFKMMAYMLQNEYDSNPNNKQVNSAASYIKKTIDHILFNKSTFGERDAKMLQQILDDYSDPNTGQIDAAALYSSFNEAEKRAISEIRNINNDLTEKAVFTAAVIRGEKINPLNNYVHLNVLHEFRPEESTTGPAFVQSFSNSLRPSTKAKSLIERTPGAKPLNFDVFASVSRGARFVYMDYHMTPSIRTARKTIAFAKKQMKENGASRKEIEIINAIDESFETAVENVLVNNFSSSSFADDVINFMSKQGYRAVLASIPRFGVELLSNLSMVAFFPKDFSSGVGLSKLSYSTQGVDVMRNVGSTQTKRVFPSNTISGRLVDSQLLEQASGSKGGRAKSDIANKLTQIYNRSLKKYTNVVGLTADVLISTPDKLVIRPMWFGTFANEFKRISGVDADMDKIAENNEQYMMQNKKAIDAARDKADDRSVFVGATDNSFMGVLKGVSGKDQSVAVKLFNQFNGFMSRFMINEFTTARTAIHAAVGNGMISRREGVALLAGVTTRMTLYTMLGQTLSNAMVGMFVDDEEEDEKSFDKKVQQSLASTMTSLLLGRDFGNLTRGAVNYGVEAMNEKYLDFLREGEYDPYKDAIQYSFIPPERKGQGRQFEDLITNLMGPLGPSAKTGSLMYKTYLGADKKEEDAIQRQEDVKKTRIPLEVFGNLGMVPLYKDIRKIVLKEMYKGLNDEKPKESKANSKKYLKENHPDLYKEFYGKSGDKQEVERIKKEVAREKKRILEELK